MPLTLRNSSRMPFSQQSQHQPADQIHGEDHLHRADLVAIRPLRFLQSVLHLGRLRTRPVILAIEPR